MYELIIAVIVILIIVLLFVYRENSIYHKLLNGVWIADNDFITESNSDSFIMIINTKEDADNMAITVEVGGQTVENSVGSVSISQHFDTYLSDVKEYSVDGYEEGFLPSSFKMKLDVYSGVLVIEKDDTVYAVLVKENNI